MAQTYIQIFSMTDHNEPLNGRFEGPYFGVNSELNTSEIKESTIYISEETKTQTGNMLKEPLTKARVIVAYRHSDTGVLHGTSELLIPVADIPWTEMPGIEINELGKNAVLLKLWNHELTLETGKLIRIHFMKTIVYLKSLGTFSNIAFTKEKLVDGPAHLHAGSVDQDLTFAPPGSSGLTVKMGQETSN